MDPAAELLLEVARAATGAGRGLGHAEWERFHVLARLHGLAGAAYPLLAGAPLAVRDACRTDYLKQASRNALLLRQAAELQKGLQSARVDCRFLKGAAAVPLLYADPGCREIGDLDVLICPEQEQQAVTALLALGYARTYLHTSRDEEAAHARESHLSPFTRPARFPVELHLGLLQGSGNAQTAAAEIWAERYQVGGGLRTLSPTHFLLHAANHYASHLRLGSAYLRWLVDIALGARKWQDALDWDDFWRAAERWRITENVRLSLSLAHVALVANVPLLAPVPVSLETALYNPLESDRRSLDWGAHRLGLIRSVRGIRPKARFLLRFAFPEARYLRQRYRCDREAGVGPLYARYLVDTSRALVRAAAARRREP